MSKLHLNILAIVLTGIALVLFAYKVLILYFPLTPHEKADAWVVEAKLSFYANNRPIKASMFLAQSTSSFSIIDESFVSRGYGFTTQIKDSNRLAAWSIRRALGPQSLYYRVAIRPIELAQTEEVKIKTPKANEVELEGANLEAVQSILQEVQAKSADTETLVKNLIKFLNRGTNENAELLLGKTPSAYKFINAATNILNYAKIPARIVNGYLLQHLGRDLKTQYRLEVFYDKSWKSFDMKTASLDLPLNFLPWWYGNSEIAEVSGSERFSYQISSDYYEEEAIVSAVEAGKVKNPHLLQFSLFNLPIHVQTVYRILLMIPVGALVAVFLRTIIGLKTFGTFMPVLIALAFRETELLWGIILFIILLSAGLLVRAYLDQLKLLLVPRLGAVLTVVVLLMAALSILAHNLGIERGLSVALFPMIIITMTIERMSIVWDELGAMQAIRQGISTIFTASIIYMVISYKQLVHLVFVFPELLLIVLAVNLLIGRYTGYRLLELYRFKAFVK